MKEISCCLLFLFICISSVMNQPEWQKIVTLGYQIHKGRQFRVVRDGKDRYRKVLPSGVYVCQLQAENFSEVKKMLLMQ